MIFSNEQIAIFDWFKASEVKNLVIKARAGTGKTTTIKAAFEHAPEPRILYAVFNKRNQKEAEAKITDCRVDVKTLHSLGYSYIRANIRNAKPDDSVEYDRVEKVLADKLITPTKQIVALVVELVGFCKNQLINYTDDDIAKIALEREIDFGEKTNGIELARLVLDESKLPRKDGKISFNDMVWLPIVNNYANGRYNLVCVDECQDMNILQLTMAQRAVLPGGRIVVVGDDRQAIYGFRGAQQNGMSMMKGTLRAQELTLTTTYRCPKLVVEQAKSIVPDFNAAPDCPAGLVETIGQTKMEETLAIGDAILSRLNAPLMPRALALLRRNIPARIEGKDIGKQLLYLIRNAAGRSADMATFEKNMNLWRAKQIDRLMKYRNPEKLIEQVNDQADTLLALAGDCETVQQMEQKIYNLFQDSDENSRPAVVLSSVHKAKGLEWKRVFMLSETFRKGKGAEEDNIWYVAVTRSQHSLYFVTGGTEVSQSLVMDKVYEVPNHAPDLINQDIDEQKQERYEIEQEKKERKTMTITEIQSAAEEVAIRKVDSTNIPTGNIPRKKDQVFMFNGKEYMVTYVNDCRAQAVPVGGGEKIDVSTTCHPSEVLYYYSEDSKREPGVPAPKVSSSKPVPAPAPSKPAVTPVKQTKPEPAPAKKTPPRPTVKGAEGKLDFIRRHLLEKKLTMEQIAKALVKQFPGTAMTTATNSTKWCVGDLRRKNKVAKTWEPKL